MEGAVAIKRPQLKGLINGVLRQFQRQQDELLAEFAQNEARFLHPDWLLKRLKSLSAAVAGHCRCQQPASANVVTRES